jgi:SNF2 family DNA or RNA helicase
MLKYSDLHKYQLNCIDFHYKHPKCALFLDMGLGKTTTSLTCIKRGLDEAYIVKALIIAPLRVANTVWKQECAKWEHLKDLNIEICTGSVSERNKAIAKNPDILVINRENLTWLVEHHKWIWDCVVIDESSSFKSIKARRFKSMRKILKYVDQLILLTGTPSPNGLLDLWPQMFLLDQGERLGKTITNYRRRFFKQTGFMGYQYKPLSDSQEKIQELISDITVSMSAEDYLELPDKIMLTEAIDMPQLVQTKYDEFEKEFLFELDQDVQIESPSAATLANKLLQICNGAIYDEEGKTHILHDAKIQCVKDVIENNPGENFFIAYNYKSDLKRLQEAFPEAVTLSKEGTELKEWNKGNIKILLAHPASAGHGLNAQYGGSCIIWFGLTWSLELYQQFNARLHRQGQTKPVKIVHCVVKNAIDQKVMRALTSKAKTQDELLEYLKFELKK